MRQPETQAEQEITQADTRDGGVIAKPPKLRNTIDCVDCGGGESFLRRSYMTITPSISREILVFFGGGFAGSAKLIASLLKKK